VTNLEKNNSHYAALSARKKLKCNLNLRRQKTESRQVMFLRHELKYYPQIDLAKSGTVLIDSYSSRQNTARRFS
jgi:hypothetical protein